jgi:predicted acetyltransferase
MSELELRPVTTDEFPAYYRTLSEVFHADPRDAERELELAVFEPDRSLAAVDGKDIVATAGIYSRTMTVPGAALPIAAVSLVSVQPTHRRRGILTSIIRRQLSELHDEQREPVAALWASESVIYQRFGYGMASQGAHLSGQLDQLRFRPEVDTGAGRVRLGAPEESMRHLKSVYEAVRPHQIGFLDRGGRWWDNRVSDLEHWRAGATSLRFALYEEPDGQVTGYAIYSTKSAWVDSEPDSEVRIRELVGSTPQATAGLWSYLLSLDLVRAVKQGHGPVDEPLLHLVADPRKVRLTLADQLWVRLADVGRGLAGRRYATELDVVLEVTDAFCPWNAGRWRLAAGPGGATCERTNDPADLALSSTELGAAYLGTTTLASLAAAGRVTELRPGALSAASVAFRADRPAWTPEIF